MQNSSYSFKETNLFSKLFCDFIEKSDSLKDFVPLEVDSLDLSSFSISDDKRDLLVKVIEEQADLLKLSSKSVYNLSTLKENNTYTVTTGHQLNIAGGPLFFTYKILSTIRACEELAKVYPEANFVPVYWSATEDHDYEEINHFFLFGKKLEWEKEFKNIPVGDLPLDEIKEFVSSWGDVSEEIKNCYLASSTLKEAHTKLVYHLFGEYGLLVLDANDARLKEQFVSTAVKEIQEQFVYNRVSETNAALEASGAKVQVSPRACNLFYLEDGKRFRVDVDGDEVSLVGSDKLFSTTDFIKEIEKKPEAVSPNVLLRPVYQQLILPNVAYIGGPGEIAYWLQLKSMFAEAGVSYPSLVPRFFALYLPSYLQKKIDKAGLSISDLFKSTEDLKARVLENDTEGEELIQFMDSQFENYKTQVLTQLKNQINQSLVSYTEATFARMQKDHSNISKKVKKEIQARNSVAIGRLESVINSLFVNGVPQERRESVFTFLINDPEFIAKLFATINPFDFRYHVLSDD